MLSENSIFVIQKAEKQVFDSRQCNVLVEKYRNKV